MVVALAPGLSGCYTFVPVQPAVPVAGQFVRAQIDTEAASRLTSVLGPGVTEVHGMVLRQENETLSVLVDEYVTSRSGLLSGYREPVALSYPEIQGLTLKQFSKQKSVIFGAAFVGAAVLTAAVFTDLGKVFTGEDGDPDTPPEMRTGSRLGRTVGFRIPVSIR
jgi:hypothetical protein